MQSSEEAGPSPSPPVEPLARQARQLLVLGAALFVAMAGFSVVVPALGDLALRFRASGIEMGAMTAAYALAQLVSAPVWGVLSDRVGRKPILVLGLLGFALSFLLMGLARSFGALMAGRVVGGALSASTLSAAQAFAVDLVEPHERTMALGRLGAAMALGFVLGPVLAVALLPFGIRAPFFFSMAVVLLTAAGAAAFLSNPGRMRGRVTGASGFGFSPAFRHVVASPAAVWFWSAFVVMFGASSVFALLVYFIEQQLHGTVLHASIVFACFGISSALCQGVLVGPLVRRLGEVQTVRAGLALGVAGFALFTAAWSVAVTCLASALIAAGMALSRPTLATLAASETPFGQGATMGLLSAFDALGRVLGPITAGLLYVLTPRAPFACATVIYALGFAYVGAARPSSKQSGNAMDDDAS
ncbi:MAG: MFS transporter [Planctomycetota bacterium]